MAASNIEKRLQALETEVAALKSRLEGGRSPTEPWWRAISGTFKDDPAFLEAMELGRQWRERENKRSLPKKKRKNARS